jgi:phosphatidylglycerophosphate synthase
MPGEDFERVRKAADLGAALDQLAVAGRLTAASVAPFYCARLSDAGDIPRVEREYLRRANGGDGEGFFTRNIRAFSIPLSRRLLRLPIKANHVTIMGFLCSLVAGLAFSFGTYAAGLVGALLYFVSMVLDCCDGEVARATFSDSRFGAWFETITDYLSYFAVLGGILWGDMHAVGFARHALGSAIGGGATFAIMAIVGYMRARIARDNPGAFDDALAADLREGTQFQQFVGWSRQLIKRSFLAHLIVFQALIGQLPALTEIWACGAVGGLLLLLAVQAHLIRSVRVQSLSRGATP